MYQRLRHLQTRPLLYCFMCLLAVVVTGFNYPVLMKEILWGISVAGFSWIEFLQADAGLASDLILLPEYHYLPLLTLGVFLFLMFVIQIDFPTSSTEVPRLFKILFYSVFPICGIVMVIPLPPILSAFHKGFIPIPLIENNLHYLLMTLFFIMLGLCSILFFLVAFSFSVYWDKHLIHTGLLYYPGVVIVSYCTQWWGRLLVSIIINAYRRKFLSFIPLMTILVVIGQLSIIITFLIFLISLLPVIKRKVFFLTRWNVPANIAEISEIPSSQSRFFITLLVFVPLIVVGWFIPYFLIALTEIPIPPSLNLIIATCVIVGGVFFYLWTCRVGFISQTG
ncbi:MAG: hypothetical protein ACFFB5_13040 [Promethearchaeota archaeon]